MKECWADQVQRCVSGVGARCGVCVRKLGELGVAWEDSQVKKSRVLAEERRQWLKEGCWVVCKWCALTRCEQRPAAMTEEEEAEWKSRGEERVMNRIKHRS